MYCSWGSFLFVDVCCGSKYYGSAGLILVVVIVIVLTMLIIMMIGGLLHGRRLDGGRWPWEFEDAQ